MHESISINIRTSKAWRLSAILGIVLAVSGLLMMPLFPSNSFVPTDGYGGPVFAFETAQNQQDLVNVFGPPDDPERASRISMMDNGNKWDFGFMIIYSLFMAAFFYGVFLIHNKGIYLWLSAIAISSGAMDAIENTILLKITSQLINNPIANGSTDFAWALDVLAYPVWLKFIAIMVCLAAAGMVMLFDTAKAWRVIGMITILSSLTILVAFWQPHNFGWLIRHGVTIGWVAMLAYSVRKLLVKHELQKQT